MVLEPDVVVPVHNLPGEPREIRGARTWAKGAIPSRALPASHDVIADLARLRQLDLAVLNN